MNVVFRADASDRMGTGHVMRCLVLADALAANGAAVTFVSREHSGHLIDLIRARGFNVTSLTAPQVSEREGENYAAWLGVSPAQDAAETIDAVVNERCHWLVKDHYGLDARWERDVRAHVDRMLVIDDLALEHDCDALLDQNYSAAGEARYAHKLPVHTVAMLGPQWALLSRAYTLARASRQLRPNVERVLVYFGGVDPFNMTTRVLALLSQTAFQHLGVDVVIGTNHSCAHEVESAAFARRKTTVHRALPDLAMLMANADICIGAGGTTTWERMCVGLPSIVVSIAENQRPTCEALGADDLIRYVGSAPDVDDDGIAEALSTMIGDEAQRRSLSERGRQLVDGCGAARVAEIMRHGRGPDVLEIRARLHRAGTVPPAFNDFAFEWIDRCDPRRVLAVRNQSHVIAQMRSTAAISPTEHDRFVRGYAERDRYDFMLVDRHADRYVGAFYVTGLQSQPEIGKYIGDSDYLGRGIARHAMQVLIPWLRRTARIGELRAVTRAGNERNIRLNESLGFVRMSVDADGFVTMALPV